MALPVLITTSHSSGFAPFDVLAEMLGEDVQDADKRAARLAYLYSAGDPYTDALFHLPGATHVNALASRFVVDLNRKRDAGGLNGVIKVTDFGGRPLYPEGFQFSEGEIEERLERHYDPFHQTITRALAKRDILFLIDGHSMSPKGPLIGPDQGRPRPAFTIITGGNHLGEPRTPNEQPSIPAEVAQEVVRQLNSHFGEIIQATPEVPDAVLINSPFDGGGIHQFYSNPKRADAVPGFAVEFNRALFLRPGSDGLDEPIPGRVEELNERFQTFARDLIPVFEKLAERGAVVL